MDPRAANGEPVAGYGRWIVVLCLFMTQMMPGPALAEATPPAFNGLGGFRVITSLEDRLVVLDGNGRTFLCDVFVRRQAVLENCRPVLTQSQVERLRAGKPLESPIPTPRPTDGGGTAKDAP